jgi:hypothetical protein
MRRNVPVKDPPSRVRHDHEDEQHLERGGRDREEIGGDEVVHVVREEGAPGLRRRPARAWPISRDRALGHVEAEPEEFAMDPRRAPQGIGTRHFANEGPDGSGEARLAGPRLRPTPPVPAESFTMPADNRRRLHEHEDAPPGRPPSTQSQPEEAIDGAEPRAAIGSYQQFQLMPKCEILKDEILVSQERGPERGNEGEAEPKHAGQCA